MSNKFVPMEGVECPRCATLFVVDISTPAAAAIRGAAVQECIAVADSAAQEAVRQRDAADEGSARHQHEQARVNEARSIAGHLRNLLACANPCGCCENSVVPCGCDCHARTA